MKVCLSVTGIKRGGHEVTTGLFFDSLKVLPKDGPDAIEERAKQKQINLRYYGTDHVRYISLNNNNKINNNNNTNFILNLQ